MIWLLRHADAEDGTPDSERKLTKKGRKQAKNAGKALKALGVKPEACFTSPKVRAAETARLVCEELGWSTRSSRSSPAARSMLRRSRPA